MTERELRTRFNAAPGYLEILLARKRAREEVTLWEVNLQRRASAPAIGRNA